MSLDALSLAELSRSAGSGVHFIGLCAPTNRVAPAVRFHFGSLPAELANLVCGSRGLHASGVFVCSDMIVSGGFHMRRGASTLVCPEANIHPPIICSLLQDERYTAAETTAPTHHVAAPCMLVAGPGYHIYGHWLVDLLPKLYLLLAAGFRLSELKLLLPKDAPPFVAELLEHLGLGSANVVPFDRWSDVVHSETLLVPTTCHNGIRFSPLFGDASYWLRTFLEGRHGFLTAKSPVPRLFATRGRGITNRPLVNRDEIEGIAVKNGFALIAAETMPMWEQWSIFASARIIVGEYGSALQAQAEVGVFIVAEDEALVEAASFADHLRPADDGGPGDALRVP
jgi:hypothetical protein